MAGAGKAGEALSSNIIALACPDSMAVQDLAKHSRYAEVTKEFINNSDSKVAAGFAA